MALEDKHPTLYFWLHIWSSFFGPLIIFILGFFFTIQNESQEDTNAYLAETINSLIVANTVAAKTEKAEMDVQANAKSNTTERLATYADINPLAVNAISSAIQRGQFTNINSQLKEKIESSPQVILSKFSIKIWYPKGNSDLRKKAFLYKNTLINKGYKNNVQVYSTGGIILNAYKSPKNTQVSFNAKTKNIKDINVMNSLVQLLDEHMEIGNELVSDFDILLVVGENA